MKKIILSLVTLVSLDLYAQVYVEGDIFNPALKLVDSTSESHNDLRVGYKYQNYDLSLRYFKTTGIGYSGGHGGTQASISDAVDQSISIRLGYLMNNFTLGAGLGSYRRKFDNELNNMDRNYTEDSLGVEFFASYKWQWGMFYLRPEVNYMLTNTQNDVKRTDGTDFIDVSYDKPGFKFLVLAGLDF